MTWFRTCVRVWIRSVFQIWVGVYSTIEVKKFEMSTWGFAHHKLNIIRLELHITHTHTHISDHKSCSLERNFGARVRRLKVSSWFSAGGDDACQSSRSEDLYNDDKGQSKGYCARQRSLRGKCHGSCDKNEVVLAWNATGGKRVLEWRGEECVCVIAASPCHRGPLLNDTSAVIAALGDHYPTGVCGSSAQMCVCVCGFVCGR